LLAARIDRVLGNYPEAEHHLAECVRIHRGSTEATQLEEVLIRAQAGEIKEVEAGLWACIEANHADSSAILETLARVYIRDSRMGAALACLKRWLEREPNTVRAWHWRGLVRERLLQPDEAIVDYKRALELDPERWGVRMRLARALLERQNPQEASPHLEKLERSHADKPEVLIALAQCRQLQGEPEKASQLADRVLAISPDDFDALSLHGQLALSSEPPQAAQAEVWMRRALAQRPMDSRALFTLSQCLEKQGKESEATKVLLRQKAAEADSMRLAELLNREVERVPHNADVLSEVGAIYLRLGDENKGLEWLYRALQEDENHKPSHELLVRFHESKGNSQKAAEHRERLTLLNGPTSSSSAAQR
jgi:tetratricopeptide (TPR) repeat protein